MRAAGLAAALCCAAGLAQAQDAAKNAGRGERLFEACRSCHSLDPAKAGMAGPHLASLAGRRVGGAEGFDYSPALKAAGAAGMAWDEARLKAYLADPDAVIRGGWMSPPGLDGEAERAALAAFLLGR